MEVQYTKITEGSDIKYKYLQIIWAATWQKQQSDSMPSEDSDQRGHSPSLIRVFAVCLMGS